MKESGLRIRVDAELRKAFIDACKERDTTASQVIRAYMRHFIDEFEENKQGTLFENIS